VFYVVRDVYKFDFSLIVKWRLTNGNQWKVTEKYVFISIYMFSLQASSRNKGPPPLLSRPQIWSWVIISTSYYNISSQKDSYFLGHSMVLYLWSPIIPGFCCKRYWLLIVRWRRGLSGKSFVSKHHSICKYCSHSSDNFSQQLEYKVICISKNRKYYVIETSNTPCYNNYRQFLSAMETQQ